MTDVIANLETAYKLFLQAVDLDDVTIQSLIGMLIDLTASKTGEHPLEVVERLRWAVEEINETEGRMVI